MITDELAWQEDAAAARRAALALELQAAYDYNAGMLDAYAAQALAAKCAGGAASLEGLASLITYGNDAREADFALENAQRAAAQALEAALLDAAFAELEFTARFEAEMYEELAEEFDVDFVPTTREDLYLVSSLYQTAEQEKFRLLTKERADREGERVKAEEDAKREEEYRIMVCGVTHAIQRNDAEIGFYQRVLPPAVENEPQIAMAGAVDNGDENQPVVAAGAPAGGGAIHHISITDGFNSRSWYEYIDNGYTTARLMSLGRSYRNTTVKMDRETDVDRLSEVLKNDPALLSTIAEILNAAQKLGGPYYSYTTRHLPGHYSGKPESQVGGPCGEWAETFKKSLKNIPGVASKDIVISDIDWDLADSEAKRLGFRIFPGHNAVQIQVKGTVFYVDNGLYGGKNHIFFPEDMNGKFVGEARTVIIDISQ